MKYIYVFDYSFGHIYEIKIKNEEFDVIKNTLELWLFKHYKIDCKHNCEYMISDEKLEIETIEKID